MKGDVTNWKFIERMNDCPSSMKETMERNKHLISEVVTCAWWLYMYITTCRNMPTDTCRFVKIYMVVVDVAGKST